MTNFYRSYRYEIIAALSGAVVMVLELVGARMIAPYFGTSTYVWTAMIGVILGALSVGYWYGGILADKGASDRGLMRILTFAALAVLIAMTFQELALHAVVQLNADIRLQAFLAATAIFAPSALLLGVVSPYVAKLRLTSVNTVGQSIGRLYAAGTLGSIAGTFIAGYWLIALMGNRLIGFSLVLVLLGITFMASVRGSLRWRAGIAAFALLGLLLPAAMPSSVVADVDSAYSRYRIIDNQMNGETTRMLMTDRFSIQSAQPLNNPDKLSLDYIKRFKTTLDATDAKQIAVIGGGVYTFPFVAAKENPEMSVDAVEIDPKLNEIARDYFQFKSLSNLRIYNEDGRVFLNRSEPGHYDMVFMDAFSSLTPPTHLVTKESVIVAKRSLTPGGVLVANVVAQRSDDPYFDAMYATYASVFDRVDVYPVMPALESSEKQNLLFVMTDDMGVANRLGKVLEVDKIRPQIGLVMTDDFSPVEQLIRH